MRDGSARVAAVLREPVPFQRASLGRPIREGHAWQLAATCYQAKTERATIRSGESNDHVAFEMLREHGLSDPTVTLQECTRRMRNIDCEHVGSLGSSAR